MTRPSMGLSAQEINAESSEGQCMLKIGLFVDITNQVEALAIHKKGHRINYKTLVEFLRSDGNLLWKAKAYGIYLTDDGISFIEVLSTLGYQASFLKVKKPEDNPNRCLEIALDIIDAYPKLDIVVIGSNSVEFVPLIHWLRARSVRVWVVTPHLNHDGADRNIDLLREEGIVEPIHSIQSKDKEKVVTDGTG
jgi:uncharacterized LabA/DUF88 family protein